MIRTSLYAAAAILMSLGTFAAPVAAVQSAPSRQIA